MKETLLTPEELNQKMQSFAYSYHLVDVHRDRLSFYAIKPQDYVKYFYAVPGIGLNYIMDGELDKVDELINSLPDTELFSFLKIGLWVVHPKLTWKHFIDIIEQLKKMDFRLKNVVLTAGRPSILNGFNDFTRISPLLESRKDLFIEDLSYLYEESICPAIYRMCLAEYYYQLNKLFDAEVLVSRTIKEFDKVSERRLLFVALYLQSKILLAQGKIVDSRSYITNIRSFVKEKGAAEFSYNIDAAEIMTALYECKHEIITAWLKKHAPDEFADFNMLDTYRYMVKMRCYIVNKKYTAVVALAEKMRPLLEEGKRHKDLCELDLILAINFYRAQEKQLAFEALSRALKTVSRRKYYRLVADEGSAVFPLLLEYNKEKGESDFLMMLIEMTRTMAINHPLYLQSVYNNETFSQMETDILKLLEQGKTKEEISEYLFISVNTVKYHLKSIYAKLNVSAAHQAVWQARVMGII